MRPLGRQEKEAGASGHCFNRLRPTGLPSPHWTISAAVGLIRFGGQVSCVGSASRSLSSDEDHVALGGARIGICHPCVAATERPSVI